MTQLIRLKTFELTEQTKETTPVSTKIVFKFKVNSKGEHVKDKARLVAKGYQELLGQEFVSTFSPMTTTPAIRLLLAFAVDLGVQVYYSDIPHAFIKATLDKKIPIALPPGVSLKTEQGSTDVTFHVDIKRALYGLKQAPQVFHRLLSTFFEDLGYQRCKVDTCIFYKFFPDGGAVVVTTSVDDCMIVPTSPVGLEELRSALVKELDVTEFGPIEEFLRLRIEQDLTNHALTISAEKQINKFFETHPVLKNYTEPALRHART